VANGSSVGPNVIADLGAIIPCSTAPPTLGKRDMRRDQNKLVKDVAPVE
jgi:hypothetical protein